MLTCKRLAVKRGVANLVENVLNYGERACVEMHSVRTCIVIWVDDDGPCIPEEDLEKVFAPFHRGEASRNRRTGGVGLGLSNPQAVAEDHGGEIRLSNRAEGGLRAEMVLPA